MIWMKERGGERRDEGNRRAGAGQGTVVGGQGPVGERKRDWGGGGGGDCRGRAGDCKSHRIRTRV